MERRSELPSPVPAQLQWFTVPIPRQTPLVGRLAGEPLGIQGHYVSRRSKPCMDWLTRGHQPCVHCDVKHLRHLVYVPLYVGPTAERLVIIVCKSAWPFIARARFGDVISAVQDEKPKRPAVVRIAGWEDCPDKLSQDLIAAGPQDIWPYLLALWGLTPRKEKHKKADRASSLPSLKEQFMKGEKKDPEVVGDVMERLGFVLKQSTDAA